MSKTVLIASSNPYITAYFQQAGVRLVEVASATEAIATLRGSPVDAAILTEVLPDGSSAMDTYYKLRHELGLFKLPLLVFSDDPHLPAYAKMLESKGETNLTIARTTADLAQQAATYLPAAA